MSTNEQVRLLMTAQPFLPFPVKLADGRHFEVRHPENIGCSVNGREMVIHYDSGMHLVDQRLVIDLAPIDRSASTERKAAGNRPAALATVLLST